MFKRDSSKTALRRFASNGLSPVLLAVLAHGVAVSAGPPRLLWDESKPVPKAAEIPVLDGVEFHVIKRWEPEVDGYRWLHGVALAWHKGKLYASFGHNKGAENTASEEAHFRTSDDLTRWRLVTVPATAGIRMWGETAPNWPSSP